MKTFKINLARTIMAIMIGTATILISMILVELYTIDPIATYMILAGIAVFLILCWCYTNEEEL